MPTSWPAICPCGYTRLPSRLMASTLPSEVTILPRPCITELRTACGTPHSSCPYAQTSSRNIPSASTRMNADRVRIFTSTERSPPPGAARQARAQPP